MNNLTLKNNNSKLFNKIFFFKSFIFLTSNILFTNHFLYSIPNFNHINRIYYRVNDTSILPESKFISPFKSSFRGMDICSDSSIWISGSKGLIVRSNIKYLSPFTSQKISKSIPSKNQKSASNKRQNLPQNQTTVFNDVTSMFRSVSPSYYNKDFRDIVAWDSLTAICMSVGDSGMLLKTKNGGRNWHTVFQDNSAGVFFDDLEFEPSKSRGLLAGDPLSGRKNLYFRVSFDSGNSWEIMPQSNWNKTTPRLSSLFAASGSSIKIIKFIPLPANDTVKTERYELELIMGGGGDSGACIRWASIKFERNWHLGKPYIHTYYQSFLDLPLYDSMQSGYGVYGLSTMIHNEHNFTVFAGGGHWKYPQREESNARMIEFRRHKDSQHHQIWNSPFSGLAYNSGVGIGTVDSWNTSTELKKNKEISHVKSNPTHFKPIQYQIFSVGTDGATIQNFTVENQDYSLRLHENPQRIMNPKNLNAVKFDGKHYWIIGSNGQIYCI